MTTKTRLMPIRDVAEMLGVSRRTIDRLVDRKEFPNPIKVGAKVMFDNRDIERWLEAKVAGKIWRNGRRK